MNYFTDLVEEVPQEVDHHGVAHEAREAPQEAPQEGALILREELKRPREYETEAERRKRIKTREER